jgi:hypothetical protein
VAIEDLDLEFEDDTEIEKSDAIEVDGDLDFSAHAQKKSSAQAQPARKAAPRPASKPQVSSQAKVQDIAQARANKPTSTSTQPRPTSTQSRPTTQVADPQFSNDSNEDYAYELDSLRSEISELKEMMSEVKNSSDVKVAVAEAKSEFLIQYISDAKLLDHQVNQMLSRIHKKVPALKNDVLSIKKYLTDFMNKTKK